jgi:hypothetical protein
MPAASGHSRRVYRRNGRVLSDSFAGRTVRIAAKKLTLAWKSTGIRRLPTVLL